MTESDDMISGINVTPLCDIFVVLLIILMVAADGRNQQGPSLELPRTAAVVEPAASCTVTLTRDFGSVYVNGARTTMEELPGRLRGLLPSVPGREVMLRVDPEVALERTVKVLDIAHANGAKAIGLGTR